MPNHPPAGWIPPEYREFVYETLLQTTNQNMDGHWEKGGCQHHEGDPAYSQWTLECAKCREINDMKLVPPGAQLG